MLRSKVPGPRVSAVRWVMPFVVGSALFAQDSQPQRATAPGFARVIAIEVNLRCYGTDRSPLFEDVLREGDVVRVGPANSGYRPVQLKMGPTGYVSKKYATPPEQGMVRTNTSDVSFRYRVPKDAEVSVDRLAKQAAPLHWFGEAGDWWKVRSPDTQAWLAEKDLQVLLDGNPALVAAAEASFQQTEARRHQEWVAASATFEKQAADAKAKKERADQVSALVARFRDEIRKPADQQDYAPITTELEALTASLPADSDQAARAALLMAEIKKQQTVLEALAIKNSEPQKAVLPPIGTPVEPDPYARFTAVGWLRKRGDMPSFQLRTGGGVGGLSLEGGGTVFEIEKGGKVLYRVSCASGRYDLSLFDGVEVGIIGTTDRPNRESIRVLDAKKIEVIASPARR